MHLRALSCLSPLLFLLSWGCTDNPEDVERKDEMDGVGGNGGAAAEPDEKPAEESVPPLSRTSAEELGIEAWVGSKVVPVPLPALSIPTHPFLDNGGDSRIHNDHYNSAVYERSGPMGPKLQILSHQLGSLTGICAALAYLDNGNAVGTCFVSASGGIEVTLYLFDPETLGILAKEELGYRPFKASSAGGAYFTLQSDETILVGPASNRLERYSVVEEKGQYAFRQLLSVAIPDLAPAEKGDDPMLQDVTLDYEGNIWFTVSNGRIGYYNPEDKKFYEEDLGEALQNSVVVDDRGIYILTYEALLRYSTNPSGKITQDWRAAYDAGDAVNGIAPGSGTSPTLQGSQDDLITICDNRAEQIQLLVLDRDTGNTLCEMPLFSKNKSATENTVIGYGDDIVVVNNSGFGGAFEPARNLERGLERYRVLRDDAQEVTGCELVWKNTTSFGNSAQLATESGVIWGYGADPDYKDEDLFYLTATSFESGEEIFRSYIGNGQGYNPVTGQVHVHPDGSLMIGALRGVISMRDR